MFDTHNVGETFVAESGGGVTIEQLAATLRIFYMGGIKIDDKISQYVQTDPGATRYFQIGRRVLRQEDEATTLREIWESLKQARSERITYEIALRWFLACPSYHLWHARNRDHVKTKGRIIILPPNATEINGKPQMLVITRGGDGPLVWLYDARLDDPLDGDFLTALEINPTPYCR